MNNLYYVIISVLIIVMIGSIPSLGFVNGGYVPSLLAFLLIVLMVILILKRAG